MSHGIPIKLLHEAAGYIITIELESGDIYRGTLKMVEDNMNCWLGGVDHIAPNGEQTKSDSAYLRGSNILYIDVPEMLVNSKLFVLGENAIKKKSNLRKISRTFGTNKIKKQTK